MHTVVRDEEWGRRGRALAAKAGQAGSWAGVPMLMLPRMTQPDWSCRGWFASVRRDLLPSNRYRSIRWSCRCRCVDLRARPVAVGTSAHHYVQVVLQGRLGGRGKGRSFDCSEAPNLLLHAGSGLPLPGIRYGGQQSPGMSPRIAVWFRTPAAERWADEVLASPCHKSDRWSASD